MDLKIGFIGLGIMGSRMAANLRAHHYEMTVFNRTRDRAAALIRDGATWAPSPAAVGREIDVLFTMLADPEAVRTAALGDGGFLKTMRVGSIWVNCSTVNPSFAREMAEAARARRVRYLDAPVVGSKEAAARAGLTFLVGGDSDDLEACRPMLTGMGQRIVRVGPVGLGSALKMVNNLIGAVAMAAFAEGTALGEALGVPRQTMFDTLMGGSMTPPIMTAKREKFERGDYEPEFPLRLIQKDLHLASITAYEAGVPMAVANVTKELYRLAMNEGYADQDFAAIYAFLHRTAVPEDRALHIIGASDRP